MTLYGKIISIEYAGELNWILTIDGHRKKFLTYQTLISYCVNVLHKGKDKKKLAMLKDDMKHLVRKCKNERNTDSA